MKPNKKIGTFSEQEFLLLKEQVDAIPLTPNIDIENGTGNNAIQQKTGDGITASGNRSAALNRKTKATGPNSLAANYQSEAIGDGSTAINIGTKAYNKGCTAIGTFTEAGDPSLGVSADVSAFACGNSSVAKGYCSFAGGYEAKSNSDASFAFGYGCEATEYYSDAVGDHTITNNIGQFACGRYNSPKTDTLFFVGNGTENQRGNAFEVKQNGKCIAGAGTDDADHARTLATKHYVDTHHDYYELAHHSTVLNPGSDFFVVLNGQYRKLKIIITGTAVNNTYIVYRNASNITFGETDFPTNGCVLSEIEAMSDNSLIIKHQIHNTATQTYNNTFEVEIDNQALPFTEVFVHATSGQFTSSAEIYVWGVK